MVAISCPKKSSKQRVLEILQLALGDVMCHHSNYIFFEGQQIKIKDGWVRQSVFCNPMITGSTKGKARLRELRQELADKYIFEKRHRRENGRIVWEYRILSKSI